MKFEVFEHVVKDDLFCFIYYFLQYTRQLKFKYVWTLGQLARPFDALLGHLVSNLKTNELPFPLPPLNTYILESQRIYLGSQSFLCVLKQLVQSQEHFH